MKRYGCWCSAFLAAAALFASCGGGSGGGSGSGTEGTATVASLSSVPSMDLSSYDYSAQAASAEIAAPWGKSLSLSVGKAEEWEGRNLGDTYGAIGSFSRAGCEANMHKKEATRMSQSAQLDRCYMEAMEKGGLITIPTGSYNYYKIIMPAPPPEDLQRMCANIPEEDKKQACLAGGEGPRGGNMLTRVGRFGDNGNELRIDMCEGAEGHEGKVNEATYAVSGNTYTGTVIRKGTWGGKSENMKFGITVAASSVTDGIADLGSSGSARAEGWMNGGFGQGHILFLADASDMSTTVQGAFQASFTDPFKGVQNSFTGKNHAKFGGISNTGTAKFSFTGTHPAMSLADMISGSNSMEGAQQAGIPADALAGFYQFMSQELGVPVNADNLGTIKVCPTPEGMERAIGNTCEESKNGLESFSIANVEQTGDLYSMIEQSFAIILDASSAFYNNVKDIDLSSYSADAGAIEFTRTDWDCAAPAAGWTLEIRPDELRAGNAPAGITVDRARLEAAMSSCNALEEKLRENMGMGGHDCADRQMRGDAGDKFGGGEQSGHTGTEGGMIPAPCTQQRLTPEQCKTYCDTHQQECFPGTGGQPPPPPTGGQMPAYCSERGWTPEQCGPYCQAHPTDCGFR